MTTPAAPAFARALAGAPGALYVVLDGALAPAAVPEAEAMGLAPRPLWLEVNDEATKAAGPHVCTLPAGVDAETIARWSAGRGMLAVWAWDGDRLSLYRHLRGLNMARIPADAVTRDPGEPALPPAPDGCVWALFRHFDPLVLQAVAPTLDETQTARLTGPARGLLFGDPAAGGALGSARGRSSNEPLRFRPGQLEAIAARRVLDGESRTLALLTAAAPDFFRGHPPDHAIGWVRDWRRRGAGLGLATEQDLALWCLLVIATRGAALSAPEVAEACARGPAPAMVRAILSGLAGGPDGARATAAALPHAGHAVGALWAPWQASGLSPPAIGAALTEVAALPTQHGAAPALCVRPPPLRPAPSPPAPSRAAPNAANAPSSDAPSRPSVAAKRRAALGAAPGLERRPPDPVLTHMRARGALRAHVGPDGRPVEAFAGSDGAWRLLAEGDVVLKVDIVGFWRGGGADRAIAATRGLSDPASYGLDAYAVTRASAVGAAGRQVTPFPRARR